MEDAHQHHGMISALGLEAGRRPPGRSWTHTPAFAEDGLQGFLWPPLDPQKDLLAKMRSAGGAWQLVQPRGWSGTASEGTGTLLDQLLLERGHVVVRDAKDVYVQLPQHIRQHALRRDLDDIAQVMNRQRALHRERADVDEASWHAARTRLVTNFELLFMEDEDPSDLGSDFDLLELATAPTSCGSSRASFSDDDTDDFADDLE